MVNQEAKRPQLFALTQRGNVKRSDLTVIPELGRGSRGVLLLKELKTNPHQLLKVLALDKAQHQVCLLGDTGHSVVFAASEIPLSDRLANGSQAPYLAKLGHVLDCYLVLDIQSQASDAN